MERPAIEPGVQPPERAGVGPPGVRAGLDLPPATGMVYSNDKVRRGDRNKMPPDVAFFLERGEQPRTMRTDGVIRIGVFDSNFKDNAGCYEIKFSLTRGESKCLTRRRLRTSPAALRSA